MTGINKDWARDPANYVAAIAENTTVLTRYAERLVSGVLQEWLTLHLEKNAKYRSVDHSLGAKGVFPDVWRKVGVLKARLWEGDDAGSGEPTVEVIDDLIGHLFLMRDMLPPADTGEWRSSIGHVRVLSDDEEDSALGVGTMISPRPVKDSPQA